MAAKGIRVNTVAPGYTETQAAQGMVNEIAQRTGISQESARQRIRTPSAASLWAGQTVPRKSPNWSHSSRQIELHQSLYPEYQAKIQEMMKEEAAKKGAK